VAAYPKESAGNVVAKDGQYLHVLFDVTASTTKDALKPHQAFVRLTNQKTGAATLFVAQPDDSAIADRKGVHRFSVDMSDRNSLFGAAEAGDYDVHIVVGDASIPNPVDWKVGSVNLQPRAAPVKAAPPLYTTPLLHESDITLAPLREIAHVFRAPESRPPAVISLAFAGAIVAALALWVLSALRLDMSFRVPLTASVWALGFHGCFGLILALFAAYWFGLTMFTTLGYLSVLAIPTMMFGRQLLVSLQAAESQ
jgi:oligosaccharyltransferase complex subunit delta (ribophorin II)